MIGENIRLSQLMYAVVSEHPELQPMTQALSITTFRYVPAALRARVGEPAVEQQLNALNEALIERIQSSGEAFLSNAVIKGRYALRACIVNFNTTEADIRAIPEIVIRLGREVEAALQNPAA